MSFEIPSLKKAISKRNVAQDLPSFRYQEVEVKEHIGNGAYGTLGKGQYNKEIQQKNSTANRLTKVLLLCV